MQPRRPNPRGGANGHPPQFDAAVEVRKTFRYKATGAGTDVSITAAGLLDGLCMAATTTSAYRLLVALKIEKVEMWGPMASDLVPVTVSCEYNTDASTGFGQRTSLWSDTSMGSADPAHVIARPPSQSLASMWQSRAGASQLCLLNFPVNTLVDITLSVVLQNGESPLAVTQAVAGATVGKVYLRALDVNGSGLLVPVSYPTI